MFAGSFLFNGRIDEGTWADTLFIRGVVSARSYALSFTLSRGVMYTVIF